MSAMRSRMQRALVLCVLALSPAHVGCTGGTSSSGGGGATSSGASGAGQGTPITLGADLSREPTSEVRCVDGYPIQINPRFPQPFNEAGHTSCALVNFLPPPVPSPGPGVAVSANIRVGPKTGPMRFIRVRQLAKQGFGVQCCSLEEYGAQFTPQANATTTVTLGFRLVQETDTDSGIIAADAIGLEVLSPDVPIPGYWTNSGGADLTAADYIFLPSFTEQSTPAPSNALLRPVGYSGFVTTFNVQYVPDR